MRRSLFITLLFLVLVAPTLLAQGSIGGGLFGPARRIGRTTFANLSTPSDDNVRYCTDCAATAPCAGSGSGAFAFRVGGAWNCTNGAGGDAPAGSGSEIQARSSASALQAVTGSSTANGGIALVNQSAAAIPFSVTGAAAQSGDLLQLTANGGAAGGLFKVSSAGAVTAAVNGALSAPGSSYIGTWITGGSATTTKPYLLIEPAGTTSTGWNTSGTGLGVNAASGFAGNLIDLQIAGSSIFKLGGSGCCLTASSVSANFSKYLTPNGSAAAPVLTTAAGGDVGIFFSGSAVVGVSTSGVEVVRFAPTVATFTGAIRQTGAVAKPTCDSSARGAVYYTPGGAGVADAYEICGKSSLDAYAWRALVTIP